MDLVGPELGAVLVFTDSEMGALLPKIRSRSGKIDRIFHFGFDFETDIKVTRDRLAGMDLTRHLLDSRTEMLKKILR